jgi:hypothetical protein
MQRRQRVLKIVDSNPSEQAVRDVLLSESTSTMIEKCNWRLRKSLLRKVNEQAQRYGISVDPTFGVP